MVVWPGSITLTAGPQGIDIEATHLVLSGAGKGMWSIDQAQDEALMKRLTDAHLDALLSGAVARRSRKSEEDPEPRIRRVARDMWDAVVNALDFPELPCTSKDGQTMFAWDALRVEVVDNVVNKIRVTAEGLRVAIRPTKYKKSTATVMDFVEEDLVKEEEVDDDDRVRRAMHAWSVLATEHFDWLVEDLFNKEEGDGSGNRHV